MTEKTEKKWFSVTFSALVEANDETHASSISWNAAEMIDEHIGSLCGGVSSIDIALRLRPFSESDSTSGPQRCGRWGRTAKPTC